MMDSYMVRITPTLLAGLLCPCCEATGVERLTHWPALLALVNRTTRTTARRTCAALWKTSMARLPSWLNAWASTSTQWRNGRQSTRDAVTAAPAACAGLTRVCPDVAQIREHFALQVAVTSLGRAAAQKDPAPERARGGSCRYVPRPPSSFAP